ncbi:MAG: membrane protein insertase YidC [Actinomycetaceae bacterium]|nr:membrane protein insertase YidC [Actinomycetaceae bacterium]
MDTILAPIMWIVAWIMNLIHRALTFLGLPDGPGAAWVLSIIGLTVVIRLLVLPLYNRQIRSSRQMMVLQPDVKKIQKKYKGKRDQESMRRQQEELQALYRKHGTSQFASCMPMLVQMPILFSLYRMLIAFPNIAEGKRGSLGPITKQLALDFENSTVFGAPLSSSFGTASEAGDAAGNVRIVAAVLVVIMSITMFYTQRQLTMKNMSEAAMDPNNPMFRTQRIMMYGMPIVYLVMGSVFQIGVLVYWVAANLWNMGQQAWFIRNNPTPGSQAYREREERLRKKRQKKGLSAEQIEELEAEDARKAGGQRAQPMGRERAKKAGAKGSRPGGQTESAGARESASGREKNDSHAPDETEVEEPTEVRGKDGLTDAERAQKRYQRRQAERARSKAKQQARKKKAQQNQKKRNF